jgi:hypothetical protein
MDYEISAGLAKLMSELSWNCQVPAGEPNMRTTLLAVKLNTCATRLLRGRPCAIGDLGSCCSSKRQRRATICWHVAENLLALPKFLPRTGEAVA